MHQVTTMYLVPIPSHTQEFLHRVKPLFFYITVTTCLYSCFMVCIPTYTADIRICGYMSSFHHPICELNLTLATSEAQVPPYELLPHSLVHTHNPLVHREHLVHIGVPAYWCIYLRHGSIVRLPCYCWFSNL